MKYSLMKSIVIYKSGGPENFIVEQRAIPRPNNGEVLVRIKAFGLNRSELMTRKGLSPNVHFPRVLGIECVGIVEDAPSGRFAQGQKVAAFMGGMGRDFDGSYAEYAALPESIVTAFESSLAWDVLGALPEMFQTVFGSLHTSLKIEQGESLLIRGGTSSIGMMAAQIAKRKGVKVIATTRKEAKKALLIENGVDMVVIDDGKLVQEFERLSLPKVDKVLELVGTNTLKDSLSIVKQGGIVCMTGMLSEQWSISDFAPMDYISSGTYLTTYDSGDVRIETEHFQQFVNDVEKGDVHVQIKKVFSLDEISEAHRFMEENSGGGKIVVLSE